MRQTNAPLNLGGHCTQNSGYMSLKIWFNKYYEYFIATSGEIFINLNKLKSNFIEWNLIPRSSTNKNQFSYQIERLRHEIRKTICEMESVPVSWFMVPVFDGGRMSFTNVNYKLKYRMENRSEGEFVIREAKTTNIFSCCSIEFIIECLIFQPLDLMHIFACVSVCSAVVSILNKNLWVPANQETNRNDKW